MLSCNEISAVVKFSTYSKIKDSTHNEAYECTREDDKMALSFGSVGDLSRYPLRAPKHNRRLDSSIDAATVNNKIDFLRSMGLALSTLQQQQQQGFKCALCHRAKCICDIRTNLVDDITMRVQNEIPNISLKACRVLIDCVQCKVCKKQFKCETDVRDHMKKRHKHRLKVTLKFDNETVSTKWIKKSHLRRHRRHSESNEVSQMVMDDSNENSVETIFERNLSKYNGNAICNGNRTKPQTCSGSRPCSAPSLGVTFDLPFCQTGNCHCCVRNNVRPWDDNNNNDCPKSYSPGKPRESIENLSVTSSKTAAHGKTVGSNTLSCQTPDWIQGSVTSINLINTRIEDNDVIMLDDTEDLSNDVMEIPIEPPCYDLTDEESYKSDNEVEKVLEIRKNQLPFITPKREIDDSENNGLRISDAIRDLIIAENSLSNHDQGDSELRTSSRNFYEEDLNAMENDDDDDDDEEDNFTLRFDDSEESCTFVIKDTVDNKEYSKSYTNNFLEDTHMEMAIDHHDALEQSSNFWQTPTKNVERFSEFQVPTNYMGDHHLMIVIKEELSLDHYLFDRQ